MERGGTGGFLLVVAAAVAVGAAWLWCWTQPVTAWPGSAFPVLRAYGGTRPGVLSLCEISNNYAAYRGRRVEVRAVYYYGLREECPQRCAVGIWRSFVDVEPGADSDDRAWRELLAVERRVEVQAKRGKRLEIWVTAWGRLETGARTSPLGPCDDVGSRYGGMGTWALVRPSWWCRACGTLRFGRTPTRATTMRRCTAGRCERGRRPSIQGSLRTSSPLRGSTNRPVALTGSPFRPTVVAR